MRQQIPRNENTGKSHGQIHQAHRRRRADADRQCRHRHDHPEGLSEDDQAHRARHRPVRRDALQGRRLGKPGFRAQQAGLPQGADPGRRRQFRLRLEPRACAVGAARFRHPLRHLDLVRRHFLQQLLQERHPADHRQPGGSGEADGRRLARLQRHAVGRPRSQGNPRPGWRRGQVRPRRVQAALPAERPRRYRPDHGEGRRHRLVREAATPNSAPGPERPRSDPAARRPGSRRLNGGQS